MKRNFLRVVAAVISMSLMFSMGMTTNTEGSKLSYENFDADYYAENYPDVVAAVGNSYKALYNHFIRYGINEGRQSSPTFDIKVYRSSNSDLERTFGNNLIAYLSHYEKYGSAEGRIACVNGNTSSTTTSAPSTSAPAPAPITYDLAIGIKAPIMKYDTDGQIRKCLYVYYHQSDDRSNGHFADTERWDLVHIDGYEVNGPDIQQLTIRYNGLTKNYSLV